MSHDALRRGRYSLRHQVYSITTITRDRYPIVTDITPARLLVRELRRLHDHGAMLFPKPGLSCPIIYTGRFRSTSDGPCPGW